MPWNANVLTACNFDDIEEQIRNKVNEIETDQGRNGLGLVTLANGTKVNHWRAGDHRIFGNYNNTTHVFSLVGSGQHVGRGNSKYKVSLCGGGNTTASTN